MPSRDFGSTRLSLTISSGGQRTRYVLCTCSTLAHREPEPSAWCLSRQCHHPQPAPPPMPASLSYLPLSLTVGGAHRAHPAIVSGGSFSLLRPPLVEELNCLPQSRRVHAHLFPQETPRTAVRQRRQGRTSVSAGDSHQPTQSCGRAHACGVCVRGMRVPNPRAQLEGYVCMCIHAMRKQPPAGRQQWPDSASRRRQGSC